MDEDRPASLKRYSLKNNVGDEKEPEKDSHRYSTSLLRDWNGFKSSSSPSVKPKKEKICQENDQRRSMEGYLLKKTTGYGGIKIRWEKRYVVLSDDSLKYTKSKDASSSGSVWRVYPFTASNPKNSACKATGQDGCTLVVDGKIFGYPLTLEFKTNSADDANQWKTKIDDAAKRYNSSARTEGEASIGLAQSVASLQLTQP
jgi:hypothetical protein